MYESCVGSLSVMQMKERLHELVILWVEEGRKGSELGRVAGVESLTLFIYHSGIRNTVCDHTVFRSRQPLSFMQKEDPYYCC